MLDLITAQLEFFDQALSAPVDPTAQDPRLPFWVVKPEEKLELHSAFCPDYGRLARCVRNSSVLEFVVLQVEISSLVAQVKSNRKELVSDLSVELLLSSPVCLVSKG